MGLVLLLRPLLTSRSGSTPSPFQVQGEISPGKNAHLLCATAGSTSPRLGHKSFAVFSPLALLGNALYPVLVHRPADYAPRFLPTLGHPCAVALRFTRCGQLVAGLAPAGVRPCWAHMKKGHPVPLFFAPAGSPGPDWPRMPETGDRHGGKHPVPRPCAPGRTAPDDRPPRLNP